MTTSGKEPEPEAEKNAGLFADMLEYREAISALAEFGPGYEVTVERHWTPPEDVLYTVAIHKLVRDAARYPAKDWSAFGSGEDLLTAVRRAVPVARIREASGVQAGQGFEYVSKLKPYPYDKGIEVGP